MCLESNNPIFNRPERSENMDCEEESYHLYSLYHVLLCGVSPTCYSSLFILTVNSVMANASYVPSIPGVQGQFDIGSTLSILPIT